MMSGISRRVRLETAMVPRAEELQQLGLKAYDALHVASAERGGADALLTTDDRLIRVAQRHSSSVHVQVVNPLRWIQETLQ